MSLCSRSCCCWPVLMTATHSLARGCTDNLGNFAKATFDAISKTHSYSSPDLWKETVFTMSPYQEFTDPL
ncbi:rCG62786 [Rattus norvegicus]|uniref:RCG62786 n=1 Tax=Rattus norvegicus TaxID=10116 RepID=A6J5R9_RAT|nr:rCG62786 [Rattus norvegicus]